MYNIKEAFQIGDMEMKKAIVLSGDSLSHVREIKKRTGMKNFEIVELAIDRLCHDDEFFQVMQAKQDISETRENEKKHLE